MSEVSGKKWYVVRAVSGQENKIKGAGGSGVTLINTELSEVSYQQTTPSIKNIRISYLEDGDVYDINNNKINTLSRFVLI